MRALVLSVLVVAGCFPGDECTPFIPGGSPTTRCEGPNLLHACAYDAGDERFIAIDTPCDGPYTCKDGEAGARCTADPEPYPACAAPDAFGQACEGDVLVRCEDGNRLGHESCASCEPFDDDTLVCLGALWGSCSTDADCTAGAQCLDVPNTFMPRCLLPCECPTGEPCSTCSAVSTEHTRCAALTEPAGSFCL